MATVQVGDSEEKQVGPALDERHIGFGAWLRQAREARGLSLGELTRRTSVPQRRLEALEDGDLSALGDVSDRSDVRAFVREVEVDEQVALALFQAIAEPGEPRLERASGSTTEEHSAVHVALALSTVFLTAILTVALFVWVVAGQAITREPAATGSAAGSPPPSIWVQNDPTGTATMRRVSMAAPKMGLPAASPR